MKFEERLSEIINEVEVPDELLPQNIAVMLKEKDARSKMAEEHRNIKRNSSPSLRRRSIIIRTSAAAAAFAVLAAGAVAFGRDSGQSGLEPPIAYEATSPDSYDALYNIYTGITINGSDKTDGERAADEMPGFSEASDIVKTDGRYLYCLKDGMLCIISPETMETVSRIECAANPPVEMYIDDNRLILISKEKEIFIPDSGNETADPESSSDGYFAPESDVPADDTVIYSLSENNSDVPGMTAPDDKTGTATGGGNSAVPRRSRTNAAVDVYDISDPANPVHTTAYKQNGRYVSSKIKNGILYLVSVYSDYRVKPLDTQADLDSFVPAYYLNGIKNYLAAENIIIPSNASGTDYTVVSAVDIRSGETAAVKAVLGSGRNVYCSDNTLYIADVGRKDRTYTVISSFDLSGGGITYRASGSVEGAVLGQNSMDEFGGLFRIATETVDEDGVTTVSVYVLDNSLTVVNSAGQLFPGGKASEVRFEQRFARIIDSESGKAVLTLNLSEDPPAAVQKLMENEACLYYSAGANAFVGVGSENGRVILTMTDCETGLMIDSTNVGGDSGSSVSSAALTDGDALLVDEENGIVGVPVYSESEFGIQNNYYVYSYGKSGFTEKGVIEYVDVDDSMIFRRGFVKDGTLYVVGKGRITAARLSDMKVIGTYEY